jgi:hypothetical protein
MNQKEEKILRGNIRHFIRHVKQKKLNEEDELRDVIRGFMTHELESLLKEGGLPDVDPVPNKSTGINVLEELLKKIIPVLEVDYKSLTTNDNQRVSFRSHIVNAVINTLTPAKVNTAAGDEEASGDLQEIDMEEEVDIIVGDEDEGPDDKFIDIRSDADKVSDEEEVEEDPRADFGAGVDGDETGRNVAYQSFKKIESSVIDSYELLSDPDDQELFYDYLIANLKLYFDKFEGELSSAVEEPTNQAYDMAKSDIGSDVGGGEDLELEL